VLGIPANVASLGDLVEGEIRAWSDPERRLSKRAKDQSDLFRIAERYPEITTLLPERLKVEIIEDRAARLTSRRGGGLTLCTITAGTRTARDRPLGALPSDQRKANQRVGKRIGGAVPSLIVLEFRDRHRGLEKVNRRDEWQPKRLRNR
jgi:hypothetical protein